MFESDEKKYLRKKYTKLKEGTTALAKELTKESNPPTARLQEGGLASSRCGEKIDLEDFVAVPTTIYGELKLS